jgi:hypothetical protein
MHLGIASSSFLDLVAKARRRDGDQFFDGRLAPPAILE